MPTLEAIRAALAAFVGGASKVERRLVGCRLVLAEGERSVASERPR